MEEKEKVLALDTAPAVSERMKKFLESLTETGQAGHLNPVMSRKPREEGTNPRQFFAEKAAGKHGGWKKWEIAKVWAPKFGKDGKPFVPESGDSRQQRRARQRKEAYGWMEEHFGGKPRDVVRAMAREKMRNFVKLEKELEQKSVSK